MKKKLPDPKSDCPNNPAWLHRHPSHHLQTKIRKNENRRGIKKHIIEVNQGVIYKWNTNENTKIDTTY
jgi:hypothetical protein